jgi:hypothetical protein
MRASGMNLTLRVSFMFSGCYLGFTGVLLEWQAHVGVFRGDTIYSEHSIYFYVDLIIYHSFADLRIVISPLACVSDRTLST